MTDLSTFEAWLKRALSPRTITAYLQTLRRFFDWLEGREATGELVDEFVTHLIATGNSNASAARHLSAIRIWFKWQKRSYELEDIITPRAERYTPKFVTGPQVKQIIDHSHSPFYRAAFALQYGAGLRFDELRNLTWDDVDFGNDQIAVISAKGGADKTTKIVPVDPGIMEIVAEYAAVCSPGLPWLFSNTRGGQLDNYQYNQTLKEVCRLAGVEPITSHGLRHSWATHLAVRDVPRELRQESLRHDDPRSTDIYTHLSAEHLRERLPPPFE